MAEKENSEELGEVLGVPQLETCKIGTPETAGYLLDNVDRHAILMAVPDLVQGGAVAIQRRELIGVWAMRTDDRRVIPRTIVGLVHEGDLPDDFMRGMEKAQEFVHDQREGSLMKADRIVFTDENFTDEQRLPHTVEFKGIGEAKKALKIANSTLEQIEDPADFIARLEAAKENGKRKPPEDLDEGEEVRFRA